jgi:hypothetical protein
MLFARVFTPGCREKDQESARARFLLVADSAHHLYPDKHKFIEVPTCGDYGYYHALKWLWMQPGDLVIIEQDLEFRWHDFETFEECRCLMCAFAYTIYPKSTLLSGPVIAHRVKDAQADPPFRWISKDSKTADIVGLGMTRFSERVKQRVYPFAADKSTAWHYTNCDTLLSDRLSTNLDMPFNIHWPEAAHHHA